MHTIKRSGLAFMLLSLLAGTMSSVGAPESAALQAQNLDKVEELLVVMRVEESMTMAMVRTLYDLVATTPEWQAHEDILLDYTEEQVGWDALKPMLITLYAEMFNDAEIEALINFYTSPAGLKLLDATPALSERTRKLIVDRFDAELAVLEMRMKHRELERIEEEMSFFQEEESP